MVDIPMINLVAVFNIMKQRQFGFAFTPTPVDEAKGVTINRVIGGERMAILDPFILLDHASIAADSEVVGFPRHPHRGIETLSFVISGEVGHKDSKGNAGTVGPGGAQWMTAGDGIYHEEMLIPGPDGAEFLQLWFSLPQAKKRIPAGYLGARAETIPTLAVSGASVAVVAGTFAGVTGAFDSIAVAPTVLDVQISGSQTVEIPIPIGDAAVAYVVRGAVSIGNTVLPAPYLVVLTDGDTVSLSAQESGARVFIVSAKPLNEPILQYRSFVMNTVEDIQETVAMIEAGTFAE